MVKLQFEKPAESEVDHFEYDQLSKHRFQGSCGKCSRSDWRAKEMARPRFVLAFAVRLGAIGMAGQVAVQISYPRDLFGYLF